MRPLAWATVYDRALANSPEDAYPDRTAGLFRLDASPKPAYYAYQTMARELERAYYLRQFQHPNIEGYVFEVGSNQEMTVLWAKTGATNVAFPYSCLRRVLTLGNQASIYDGSGYDLDGVTNGYVSIRVEQDAPLYVEPCP